MKQFSCDNKSINAPIVSVVFERLFLRLMPISYVALFDFIVCFLGDFLLFFMLSCSTLFNSYESESLMTKKKKNFFLVTFFSTKPKVVCVAKCKAVLILYEIFTVIND